MKKMTVTFLFALVVLLIMPIKHIEAAKTTLRDNELEFSSGILIQDIIDEVLTDDSYPLNKSYQNYFEWYTSQEAKKGTVNITLTDDAVSDGAELWMYVRNAIFINGSDDVELGVTTSIAENYHGGIQGVSTNVVASSYTDITDESGILKSNYFTSLQAGVGKFDESIWAFENDNDEMIIGAYKGINFSYEPEGQQNLALNALGGDVSFFDSIAVTSVESNGCVGLGMTYNEMKNGDCDTVGLQVSGNIKFGRLFGKIGSVQVTLNSGSIEPTGLQYDDQPWTVATFEPTGDTDSTNSFTFKIGNSSPITYNFAILSQYTLTTEYETSVQGWMLVDAWTDECTAGSGEDDCSLIGDNSIRGCSVSSASRYAWPGSFTHEEQLHVSNLSVFDFQEGFNENAPFYFQFAFVAPLEANATVNIRIRHCIAPAIGKTNANYNTLSIRDIQQDSSKKFQVENISATIYALPSW
jgi:hypothetical protein